jgi:outer membrane murein-binding lipoprotein Lpp
VNLKIPAAVALAAALLSGCATAQRIDAAGDVHALLVSIRDNDQAAFDAHVDRQALKREIEARLMTEVGPAKGGGGGLKALGALLAPTLADMAGEALLQPQVFRQVAEYYGYKPATPIPGQLAISSTLQALPDGRVCATRKKHGPCLLVFTRQEGVWRLTGFEGALSELHLKT